MKIPTWKIRTTSIPTFVGSRSLAPLLAVLMTVLIASTCVSPTYRGVTHLELTGGTITARATVFWDQKCGNIFYESRDAGISWQDTGLTQEIQCAEDTTPSVKTDTQQGEYQIEGTNVIRVLEGEHSTVFSTEHWNSPLNRLLLERITHDLWKHKGEIHHRKIPDGPLAIIHHPQTGNIVIALGLLGIATLHPDGTVTQSSAGPYRPVDLSPPARVTAFLNEPVTWAAGIALAAVSLALALTTARLIKPQDTTAFMVTLALAMPSAIIGGAMALLALQAAATPPDPNGVPGTLKAAGAVLFAIMAIAAAQLDERPITRAMKVATASCAIPMAGIPILAYLAWAYWNTAAPDPMITAVACSSAMTLLLAVAHIRSTVLRTEEIEARTQSTTTTTAKTARRTAAHLKASPRWIWAKVSNMPWGHTAARQLEYRMAKRKVDVKRDAPTTPRDPESQQKEEEEPSTSADQ